MRGDQALAHLHRNVGARDDLVHPLKGATLGRRQATALPDELDGRTDDRITLPVVAKADRGGIIRKAIRKHLARLERDGLPTPEPSTIVEYVE